MFYTCNGNSEALFTTALWVDLAVGAPKYIRGTQMARTKYKDSRRLGEPVEPKCYSTFCFKEMLRATGHCEH